MSGFILAFTLVKTILSIKFGGLTERQRPLSLFLGRASYIRKGSLSKELSDMRKGAGSQFESRNQSIVVRIINMQISMEKHRAVTAQLPGIRKYSIGSTPQHGNMESPFTQALFPREQVQVLSASVNHDTLCGISVEQGHGCLCKVISSASPVEGTRSYQN